ncbi:threonine aspartase 1-like [Ornithodoros turicata]|uniref:threonine aspartase 1-like n=1 Tax=Ornithodoros turicata TaxID=34597 RepID=UPI003138BA16
MHNPRGRTPPNAPCFEVQTDLLLRRVDGMSAVAHYNTDYVYTVRHCLLYCSVIRHMMKAVIAVHVGAGYHSELKLPQYKRVCKTACQKATAMLENSECTAVDAVTAAVTVLENDPITNAGFGSNLTLKGTVECDASVMDGRSLNFGAVGALSGYSNPILVAREICNQQVRNNLTFGRLPPCFLVGNGAAEWARENVLTSEKQQHLVSEEAKRSYLKYKRKIERHEEGGSAGGEVERLDTVGAVCLDKSGNVASAVSSGGVLLKHPGRVGQAAVYGCGCWSELFDSSSAVAVSTSGGGEHLIKTMLARRCAEALRTSDNAVPALSDCLKEHFLQSRYLKGVDQKLGGVLALSVDHQDAACDVIWAHSTKSLCYGYMETGGRTAKFGCSRLEEVDVGRNVVVGGVTLRLSSLT